MLNRVNENPFIWSTLELKTYALVSHLEGRMCDVSVRWAPCDSLPQADTPLKSTKFKETVTMQTILSAPPTNCYLIAKNSGDAPKKKIPVTPPFRIGRREGFDLCLANHHVSGLHAEILEENGKLWVYDLNSINGTFVNEVCVRDKTQLFDKDVIRFGQLEFSFVASNDTMGRRPEATICAESEAAIPESSEERFMRLLKEGVVPNFQPVFDISGNQQKQVGYEVLGRSRLFGLGTPDEMFAAATDLEMEAELSRVLRLRGIEAAESRLPDDALLFVNTHPTELECGKLEESINEIRRKHQSRPSCSNCQKTSCTRRNPILRCETCCENWTSNW